MKIFLRRLASATVAVLTLWPGANAWATPGQPGTLDLTWAGTGKQLTPVAGNLDEAYAMAIQADGKIVQAGECASATVVNFCAVRYNTDGSLDTGFNGTGKVISPTGSSTSGARGIAIQSDGKIVLAGYCFSGSNQDFCALRLNSNGSLDNAFNGSGKVITPVGSSSDFATAVAVQIDGRIVVAGACDNGTRFDFCAVRYNANGGLDSSFNGSGKVITPNGSFEGIVGAVAIQTDGKIVLVGTCGSTSFCGVRYNVDGSLDTTANGGGFGANPGGRVDQATAIAIQADGKFVVAGSCYNGTVYDFCMVRFDGANASLDFGFSGTWRVITPVGNSGGLANAAFVQPDGKIVLAGLCNNGGNFDFCAVRYHANGTLDSGFNGSGKLLTPVGNGYDRASAAAIQSDGKIVLAGSCANSTGNNVFCTARYDGGPFGAQNCKLDIDGDNRILPATDSLIHARIALGLTGDAVVAGIAFPAEATRKTWASIRTYLVAQCGMNLPL